MLWFAAACVPEDQNQNQGEFSVTTAGMDTVWVARWHTTDETSSHVVASFEGETLAFDDETLTTDHEVLLIGIPSATDAVVDLLEGREVIATASLTTGRLPAWVPTLSFAGVETGQSGLTLVPIVPEAPGGVVAIDGRGRIVWSYPPDDEGETLIVRARLSLDGLAVLYNTPAESAYTPGLIHRVSLIDSSVEEIGITGAHLDFVEYTPGGYASLGWDIREIDGRMILGDTIVERSPEGVERTVWRTWDDFEPDLTQMYPDMYTADRNVEDWTHVNGMSYRPDEDAIYVTMTFNDGVAKVDRTSGEMDWVLADLDGDFAMSESKILLKPHSAQRLDDGGLLVFNRGDIGHLDEGTAYVEELSLDEELWTAASRWSYADPAELVVAFLGSAERLDSGNTLISWSSAGQVDEVTADGEIVWQVYTGIGHAFGFASRYPRLGP